MSYKREKKYEPISVPQSLMQRMLDVIDSDSVRNYFAEDANYSVYAWTKLVANAPRPMDLKLELLRELRGVDIDQEALEDLNNVIDLGELLMDQLYHLNPETSVLVATYYDSRTPDAFEIGKSKPFQSYDEVLEDIRNTFFSEGDGSESQAGKQDRYIQLRVFHEIGGKYGDHAVEYYCDANGTVYFVQEHEELWREHEERLQGVKNAFSGENGLTGSDSPFHVGDIVYVDLRPWYLPTYCLLYWLAGGGKFSDDSCGIQCLYPTYSGLIEDGAFKHGCFLPKVATCPHCERPFIGALYRAERYTGELPEECAFMKPLSDQLRKDPGLSQKMFHFAMDYRGNNCTRTHKTVVLRPVPVEKPNEPVADRETDAVWHPDQIQWEPWDKSGRVIGAAKEKLFAIAGVSRK